MYNPIGLDGKLILVTGASSGIGRASAQVLSRLGARVILTGRRQDALMATLEDMENRELHVVEPFDLTEVDGIPGWLKGLTTAQGQPLDGVVHSAGLGGFRPIRALSRQSCDDVMTTNVYAALALIKGASAKNVGREGSSIVLLSSVAGLVGSPGLTAYSATKGALQALARSAAVELAAKRIRVNCVAPGYVETPLLDQARATIPAFERIEERQFLGLAKPEEIGVAIAYLLSDAARLITGTTLVIDGGFSC